MPSSRSARTALIGVVVAVGAGIAVLALVRAGAASGSPPIAGLALGLSAAAVMAGFMMAFLGLGGYRREGPRRADLAIAVAMGVLGLLMLVLGVVEIVRHAARWSTLLRPLLPFVLAGVAWHRARSTPPRE